MKAQNIQYNNTPCFDRDVHFPQYLEGMIVEYFCLHMGICGDVFSKTHNRRKHANGFVNYGGCVFLNKNGAA